MKIRAAVLRRSGLPEPYADSKPLTIEDVQLEGPGPGQVLVKVASAGLCGSDLSAIAGRRARTLPAVLGHEGAGEVVEVGDGVRDLSVGDHVVMVFVTSCGRCEFCVIGRPNLCADSWEYRSRGLLADGTSHLKNGDGGLHHWSGISSFAEYAVVQRESLVRVPREVSLLDAAVLGCAVITGAGAVFNTARVRPGDTVAVTGLGGVGLSAVMAAKVAGAKNIIAVDTNPAKLEVAREFGATSAVDGSAEDAVEQILDETDGGVVHSIETAGASQAAKTAYGIVRRGGQMIAASLPASDVVLQVPLAAHASDERRVVGSYMGSSIASRDIPALAELYLQGRLPIDKLRSSVMPLEQINEGFDRLAQGRTVRDAVVFDDGRVGATQ